MVEKKVEEEELKKLEEEKEAIKQIKEKIEKGRLLLSVYVDAENQGVLYHISDRESLLKECEEFSSKLMELDKLYAEISGRIVTNIGSYDLPFTFISVAKNSYSRNIHDFAHEFKGMVANFNRAFDNCDNDLIGGLFLRYSESAESAFMSKFVKDKKQVCFFREKCAILLRMAEKLFASLWVHNLQFLDNVLYAHPHTHFPGGKVLLEGITGMFARARSGFVLQLAKCDLEHPMSFFAEKEVNNNRDCYSRTSKNYYSFYASLLQPVEALEKKVSVRIKSEEEGTAANEEQEKRLKDLKESQKKKKKTEAAKEEAPNDLNDKTNNADNINISTTTKKTTEYINDSLLETFEPDKAKKNIQKVIGCVAFLTIFILFFIMHYIIGKKRSWFNK